MTSELTTIMAIAQQIADLHDAAKTLVDMPNYQTQMARNNTLDSTGDAGSDVNSHLSPGAGTVEV